MIHIYHGRGKGKTSAALGAALRAHGQGFPVLVVQFMKDAGEVSGEVEALKSLDPPVRVLRARLPYPIYRPPHRRALEEMKGSTRDLFDEAASLIRAGDHRMAVLDELGIALSRDWLDPGPVESLLDGLPDDCELIVTGRRVPRWLLERADLVTRMTKVRHPYDRGVKARKGIEY